MDSTIAVTGSTGRVGSRVAALLAAAGARQRLLVRDPARAPQLAGAEVATASYQDTPAVREALRGIEVLFLVSAPESKQRLAQHQAIIDAAAAAGVQQVVYTSFHGAAPDATFALARDHGATEDMLRASGMAWTFLRDNFYQEAFLDFTVDGVIAGPAGDGRCAAVALDDVAGVAAAVLQDPGRYRNRALELTGPEALTVEQIASTISTVAHRPTRYQPETVEEAHASRRRYGAPQWQLDAWVSTYTSIAGGEMAQVSPDVERVLGRPATSLRRTLERPAD